LKTDPRRALSDETALLSGYILYKVELGEPIVTTSSVKDEVSIWLSRYRATNLQGFLQLLTGYTSLELVNPTLDDQVNAGKILGKYKLGFVDLLSICVMKRLGLKEIYSSDTGLDSVQGIRRLFDSLKDERGFKDFSSLLASRKSISIGACE